MEITPLSSLKPFKFNYRICVRISRTWRAIQFGAEKYNGLHCVMIDQQGSSVHGFMPEDQVNDMVEKPKAGQMYEIHQFSTREHSYGLQVVPNTVILHFNSRTIFCKVAESVPPVPANYFRLVQFSKLAAEREAHAAPASHAILTDVYGCIKSIRPPHPQYIKSQNKNGVKCEIVLENLSRETLTIVLWGKLAREFDITAITSLPPPVLGVFAGLKMTLYNNRIIGNNSDHTCLLLNPQTDWTETYQSEFSKPGDKTIILGDFHVFETKETKDVISVRSLTGLDPAEYKARSVICKGEIIKISSNGWWYNRCPQPNCHKQCFKIEEAENKYKCKAHGIQTAMPCFRVNLFIADEFSDIAITVMGNQAEQLFGSKLEPLRSKRQYVTDQDIPPEVSAVISQNRLFELKGNAYREWIAIAIGPNEDHTSTPQSPDHSATTSTTVLTESALKTPQKLSVPPKRTPSSDGKELLPGAKKTKKETKQVSESSSTTQTKDKLD